ncbi:hypothetical protein F1D05_12510 [Kribbella qitaiheensis]|uniref:Uncharacterized protein n=1 Tax=Kribbella qitaiheensis TaxID=1544730 RepID=A0A7G6WX63_9ACTN|nr:hypothetical protein [Kribbella qitaiheensis]QNE18578.1 hypothetical protein F1D05_12510 [Kribbella qitaiheensis]
MATWVMLALLAVVCLLTWLDPLVRKDRTTAAIGVVGWIAAAVFSTWRAVFVDNPMAIVAWGAAGIYLLAIVTTLGRPILILSDLLEEKEETDGTTLPANLWRRSKFAQVVLLLVIAGGITAVMI